MDSCILFTLYRGDPKSGQKTELKERFVWVQKFEIHAYVRIFKKFTDHAIKKELYLDFKNNFAPERTDLLIQFSMSIFEVALCVFTPVPFDCQWFQGPCCAVCRCCALRLV